MTVVHILFFVTGLAVCIFFAAFGVSSIREKKPRAALVSAAMLIAFGLVWFGGYALLTPAGFTQLISMAIIALVAILFFMPLGKAEAIRVGKTSERFDERDAIFSREEYHPGTEKHERYYAVRPEFKEIDDKMRELPELLEPGGRYYDPIRSRRCSEVFDMITELGSQVDGEVNPIAADVDPVNATRSMKDLTLQLGADEVGIALLNRAYIYTHVGRGPEPWGSPIDNSHKFAIAFDIEMSYTMVEQAPRLAITEETAQKYLRAAEISISLAEYIRKMGYPARAHIAGSNYQIILPPVAYEAGLGELGRHGYLISQRFGARIRLGAVTTDLPLIADKPITFGVQDFCEKCLKCATLCPSASIPKAGKTVVRGVEKWQLDAESCLHYWRKIGTDCGLCMKVCPFSHPGSFVHRLIREGIRRSSFARTVSVYGDDLFYGKRAKF
jgi:reductive dehalogenase